MTIVALMLVLTAAVFHATWNLAAKQAEKSGGGGPLFVCLFTFLSSVLYTPVALYILFRTPADARPGLAHVGVVAVSALIHLGYYLTLQKGYRVGDLSIVYPVARGSAPLIATAGAIAIFGERPSPVAFLGALLVSVSIFLLAGDRAGNADPRAARRGVRYGLLIATIIATYTLWDKHAVSGWLIAPVLVDWGANTIRTVMMLPYVLPRRAELVREWKRNWPRAVQVAIFSPLAYILVLQALSFTPASYIAPAREVSILVGTAMGARFLNEGVSWKRLAGAGTMVVALAALALG